MTTVSPDSEFYTLHLLKSKEGGQAPEMFCGAQGENLAYVEHPETFRGIGQTHNHAERRCEGCVKELEA